MLPFPQRNPQSNAPPGVRIPKQSPQDALVPANGLLPGHLLMRETLTATHAATLPQKGPALTSGQVLLGHLSRTETLAVSLALPPCLLGLS